MITYNNIVSAIKDFFDRHLQVKQFLCLDNYDEEALENVYVTALLVPQQSAINGSQMTLNFNLFVVDLLNSDGSNKKDVYSDTLEIIRDFVAYFTGSLCTDFTIGESTTVSPINEKFVDDIVCGWVLTFGVDIPFSLDSCNIPLE
mgnify:FL=1